MPLWGCASVSLITIQKQLHRIRPAVRATSVSVMNGEAHQENGFVVLDSNLSRSWKIASVWSKRTFEITRSHPSKLKEIDHARFSSQRSLLLKCFAATQMSAPNSAVRCASCFPRRAVWIFGFFDAALSSSNIYLITSQSLCRFWK